MYLLPLYTKCRLNRHFVIYPWPCSGPSNTVRLLLDLGYSRLQAIMGPRVLVAPTYPSSRNGTIAVAVDQSAAGSKRRILERQGDSIWFLSGPGALTLAFCHFYKRELRQLTLPAGVHIVDTFTLSRTVAQHLPLAYKHRGAHWNHQKQRNRSLFRNPSGRPRAA